MATSGITVAMFLIVTASQKTDPAWWLRSWLCPQLSDQSYIAVAVILMATASQKTDPALAIDPLVLS